MDLSNDKIVSQIVSRLRDNHKKGDTAKAVKVDGTWGSFAPMLAACLSKELKRPILYLCPHIDDADNVFDDLQVFAGSDIELFPVWQDTDSGVDATDEIASQRLRIALGLSRASSQKQELSNLVITTCVQAINQPVPSSKSIEGGGLKLNVAQTIEPSLISEWLVDAGFERVDAVDIPGQYAHRGGIIDIYAPVTTGVSNSFGGSSEQSPPVRIEFFGDTIESIRKIDLDTQRSTENVDSICVVAPSGHEQLSETEMLLNLLPQDTLVVIDEPVEIADVSSTFIDRMDDPTGLYSWQAVYTRLERFNRLEICRFGSGNKDEYITLDVNSAQQYEHKAGQTWKSHTSVLEELYNAVTAGQTVELYCENTAERKRVTEIINESLGQVPSKFLLPLGFIRQGFVVNSLDTIVLSHHEIFGQCAVRRRIRKIRSTSPVESLIDLQAGDYVVHLSYGIGKYIGTKIMERNGSTTEFLTLEYADKALIHVPVHNIHLVQKYIGALPKRPKLSKIGTKAWENQKKKVAAGVEELAAELLRIQAQRESIPGFAFGPDTVWQKEFEGAFLYTETEDQLVSIEQIKADMAEARPMDRLLCGDVGYGKTELAMRAAFKAVQSGKQVAVLVPTTVLSVQHCRTFTERFADFPVTVDVLNRFVPNAKATEITFAAKRGSVDILIGTHRLLSNDVGFKDLGLVIIDEEQRFGVEHKERLKRFTVNVDILTMTATPIPRTLHMSLLGLRDISSLQTAPLDRRSVVTKVCRFDNDLIRKAIKFELDRQGQIFFVHNRVQNITRIAEQVRKIVNNKDVTIEVAHGQMPKSELERAMVNFVNGKTDILVCSTIIESGLDIPNANTMIINEADRFGLAQLHQLRGRVGRYKNKAYAYMLLPATRSITPIAAKRLKAIEEYSQLGAGFRIALRDLEIRGAGNILGPEQSGHINTVGYEMYCRLLSDAVKRLKNEPVETPPTAIVDLGFSTYIPKSYISSDRQRMDVYRRIAGSTRAEDLKYIGEELADLFGSVPAHVNVLIDLADIRIRASKWNIKSIIVNDLDVVFNFQNHKGVSDIFAKSPGKVRIVDAKTVYLRLTKNYFEPKTLMAVLRKML